MEPNGLPGRIYSTMDSGMLGLEMSLHHQPPPNPRQLQHHPLPQMVVPCHHEADHRHPPAQPSVKQNYQLAHKAKPIQQFTLSDEDDPGPAAEDSPGDGKTKISPWHRMKWTDSMVRLLIMVVFYIGDEAGPEGTDPVGKKKGGGGGGVLQKKGKWKSVSRAMMERDFYVSPQQCEDKFNDLNKRYKRVNDILGKGTACRVVENQSLLDTMDHVPPKRKEEVKKLLNSKHLFFREMCAYHNSCGGGGGGGGSGSGGGGPSEAHHSPEAAAEPSKQIGQHPHPQSCFHSSDKPHILSNSGRTETDGSKLSKWGSPEEEEDEEEEENDGDDEEDEDGDEIEGGGVRDHEGRHEEEEEDGGDNKCLRKRPREGIFPSPSPLIQQLSTELTSMIQDGTKSLSEKGQWMKSRLMLLEEQRVSYQIEALEIEKQRLKWVKFSGKKEREMERDKLKNGRLKLENERMVLLLRQKELELFDMQQLLCSNKRSDPSSVAL